MKNLSRTVLIFILIFCSCITAFSADDKYVILDVEGEGADRASAMDSAWLEGIRQAAGSFIDSKTELNDDKLTERIISYSRGLVEKYEIISVDDSKVSDGIYKLKMRMWIVKEILRDGTRHAIANSAEISFSASDLKKTKEDEINAANANVLETHEIAAKTVKRKAQTAAELLEAMLDRYKPEDFLSCYIPSKPEAVKGKSDVFNVNVELNFNEKLYKEAFIPDLIQVLDQIASVKKNTLLSKYKNELRDIASKKGVNIQLQNSIIMKALENENDCTLAVFDKPERLGVKLYGFNADDTDRINAVLENFQARISNIKGLLLKLFDENDEVMESIENKFNINFLISNADSNRWSFQPTILQITKVENTVDAQTSQHERRRIGEGLQSFSPTGTVPNNISFRVVFRNPVMNKNQIGEVITQENSSFPFEVNPPLQLKGYWQNERTFTATLVHPLENNYYTATIKDNMKDRRGNKISGTFSFNTERVTVTKYTVLENTQITVPVAFEMPEEILPYVKKIRASLLIGN